MKALYVLLAASLVLLGCVKNKTRRLDVQVFVVTKGGENIRLGLVPIQVARKADVKAYLGRKRLEILPRLKEADASYPLLHEKWSTEDAQAEELDRERSAAEGSLEELRSKRADYTLHVDELVRAANQGIWRTGSAPSPETQAENQQRVRLEGQRQLAQMDADIAALEKQQEARRGEVERLRRLKEIDIRAASDAQETDWNLRKWKSLEQDLFSLPSLAMATTDADGRAILKFSAEEEVVLIAAGQRAVGEKNEKYVWVVCGPGSQLLLSNDNLLQEDDRVPLLVAEAYASLRD